MIALQLFAGYELSQALARRAMSSHDKILYYGCQKAQIDLDGRLATHIFLSS